MTILADVAVAPTILFGGWLIGIAALIIVLVLEGAIFYRLKWGSLRRSFVDSAIVNVVSAVLGLIVWMILFSAAYACDRIPADNEGHFVTACGWRISPYILLVMLCGISILIEGVILLLLKRHPNKVTWRAAVIANVVSYIVLSPVYLGLFFLTR